MSCRTQGGISAYVCRSVCLSVRMYVCTPLPMLAQAAQRQDQAAQRLDQTDSGCSEADSGCSEAGSDYLRLAQRLVQAGVGLSEAGFGYLEAGPERWADRWMDGRMEFPPCVLQDIVLYWATCYII